MFSGDFARVPKVMTYSTLRTGAAVKDGAIWALVLVEANAVQLLAIDADTQCVDIFERLSDASNAVTRADLIAWLKLRTLASVSSAVRTRIRNRLTAVGISVAGLTTASTFYDVIQRVLTFHAVDAKIEDLG